MKTVRDPKESVTGNISNPVSQNLQGEEQNVKKTETVLPACKLGEYALERCLNFEYIFSYV